MRVALGAIGLACVSMAAYAQQVPSSGAHFSFNVEGAIPDTSRDQSGAPAPTLPGPSWKIGLLVVSGSPVDAPGQSGVQVTAMIPIAAVPGLDMVVNVGGERDATIQGGTAAALTATAGVRLGF